ncbi:Golgi-associated plant pathogenesis-related protein 1-like [Drosophila biarmipes]|uniref:Golgi-associated plant pathogenesis-related protein 1-like n=1 Tax=Drosophila biarmipes TaxID=125945 RepID=UPI0007E82E31|nr:Golgi-associated plant pathogenesis-related protein 1-like [Drosophila biarmipes]
MALVNILIVLAFCWLVAVKAGKKENSYLSEHNRLRKLHGTPPLVLDDALSKGCEEYAKVLAKTGVLKHSSDGGAKYGENLCMRSKNDLQCVQDWYDEIKLYDFSKPGFSMDTGHFTALVWKGAKKLGIGVATDEKGYFWVCGRYFPPTNVHGLFKEHVPKPIKWGGGGSGGGSGSNDDDEDNSNMVQANSLLVLVALCLHFRN